MEIKATLNKPYTNTQRLNFIVLYNHQHGYEIRETQQALEAWGKTAEETAEEQKQAQKAVLIAQLDAIDLKCIRSIRAIQAGTSTAEDEQRLSELEAQAENIREQIRAIDNEAIELDNEQQID